MGNKRSKKDGEGCSAENSKRRQHYQIPTVTLQVLDSHDDEVWCVEFSHDGKYLASGSRDCTAIIWELGENCGHVSIKHKLSGHEDPVSHVAWSPNDKFLLTCGHVEVVKLWNVENGECVKTYDKGSEQGFLCCGWFPDNKQIISVDTKQLIHIWDIKDRTEWECTLKGELETVPDIAEVVVTHDGKEILIICELDKVWYHNFETRESDFLFEEDWFIEIMSLCISKDNRFVLVTVRGHEKKEIHMWDIRTEDGTPDLLVEYKCPGSITRGCIGGFDDAFVTGGSEDSKVYIWERSDGHQVLQALAGHEETVNWVSWNLANPGMLASASCDNTIRIWGTEALRNAMQVEDQQS